MGIPLVWMVRISCLPVLSGMGMEISLSNLPGRLRAGSRVLGMFVAPITTIWPLDSSPSIRASSWATTRRSTCFSPPMSSLLGAMASISSIKIIDGAWAWASSNTFRSLSSLSP